MFTNVKRKGSKAICPQIQQIDYVMNALLRLQISSYSERQQRLLRRQKRFHFIVSKNFHLSLTKSSEVNRAGSPSPILNNNEKKLSKVTEIINNKTKTGKLNFHLSWTRSGRFSFGSWHLLSMDLEKHFSILKTQPSFRTLLKNI